MKSIRAALIQTLSTMTEKQAHDIVLALGQWADNQRNYIDDDCGPDEVQAAELAQLAAADAFVEAGDAALIAGALALSSGPGLQ